MSTDTICIHCIAVMMTIPNDIVPFLGVIGIRIKLEWTQQILESKLGGESPPLGASEIWLVSK